MFLSASDLRDLTGCKRKSRQIAWLQSQGFAFRVAADGSPRVLTEHVSKAMGGGVSKRTQPDFSSLGA